MHKRSLIIGIGIGVILGALLLQLFNLGSESQQKLDEISAEINGVEHEADPAEPLESDPQPSSEPVQPEEDAVEAPTAPELEQVTSPEEQPVAEVVTPTPAVTPEQVQIQQYVLRVHPGSPVSKTAKVLVDHAIIQNEKDFAAYMKEKKTEIRAGFFLVAESSTNEQIRKLLSGEPLSESERKSYIDVEKLSIIE